MSRSVFFEMPNDVKSYGTLLDKACKALKFSDQSGIFLLCYSLFVLFFGVYGYSICYRFVEALDRRLQQLFHLFQQRRQPNPTPQIPASKIDKAATDSDECSSEQSSPGHRATTSRARRHDKKKRR